MSQAPAPAPEPSFAELERWLDERRVTEIECLVPDLTGVARGKILPREKFTEDRGMRLPRGGGGDGRDRRVSRGRAVLRRHQPRPTRDMHLRADPTTVRIVPWAADPTAQVIHDCYDRDGKLAPFAPRSVLRRVVRVCSRPRAGSRWSRPSSSSTWSRATPTRTCRSSRRSAAAAAPRPRARPIRSTRSTSSTRCSRTSTATARRWS